MTAGAGASANNPTIVTESDAEIAAREAADLAGRRARLTPEQLDAEAAALRAALARNREVALEDLARQRARRDELVVSLDAKIAEAERMIRELDDQLKEG